MSDLESSLRQRLLDSQADFLAVRDTAALHAFSERWATLCEDFEQALNSQPLDDSLVSLAQSIASHLVAFAELQLREQELTDAFLQEVDVLFSEMSLSDDHVPVAPSPRRQAARRRPSPTASILPFYPASYDWLLHNLHDPYPSTALKSSLANSAKVTTNLIDSWFKAIRKEIGWDALRRRHFKGSRSFTSAAALRCFVEDSQNLPFEIASAFIVMKEKAEALFPSPNPSSTHRRSSSTSSLATDDSGTSRTTPFSSSSDSPVSSRPPSLVFSISDSDVEESPVSYSSWHASLDQLQSLRDGICAGVSGTIGYDQLTDAAPCHARDSTANTDAFPHIMNDKARNGVHPTRVEDRLSQLVDVFLDTSSGHMQGSSGGDLHSTAYIASQAPSSRSRKRRRSDADVSPPSKRRKPASRPQVVSAPVLPSTDLRSSAATSQQSPVIDFQTILPDGTHAGISQYLDTGYTCKNVVSFHVPPIEEMWADDSRPFCEMVEDAPSSTTLKLLPLPDTNAPSCTVYPSSFETRGDNASFPSKPATFNAINERELPPIHWSSSSLAGALGPLNTVTSEPSTAPENPLPEGSSLTCEVDVPTETQERESHAVIASFPEAIFPRFNWNDLLEEVTPSSISSMLEEAGTYEQQSLQQLLDLLDSPSYVGPAF